MDKETSERLDRIEQHLKLLKDSDIDNRLVFHFGMSEQQVKDKLYEKDIILEYYKEFEENGNRKTNPRNS
jgi:hypothetical protein